MKHNRLNISIIILLLLCFLDIMNVNATLSYSSTGWPDCVNDGSCIKMCGYENDFNKNNINHQVGIYVYYNNDEKNIFIAMRRSNVDSLVYKTSDSNIHFINYKNTDLLKSLNEGDCPKYAYTNDVGKSSEICFENSAYDALNNISSCEHYYGGSFAGNSELRYNYYNDYGKDIDINNYYLNEYDCSTFNSNNNIIDSIDEIINEYSNQYFSKYNGNVPSFLINDKFNNIITNKLTQAIDELSQKCQTNILLNPNLNDAQKKDALAGYTYNSADVPTKINASLTSLKAKFSTPISIITLPVDLFDSNCADFSDTIRIFGILLLIIKILLPLIIIVKTSFDLISVITKGEPDELKKKTNKFLVSIGCAILIFFIPTIVSSVFDFVSRVRGTSASTEDMQICISCLFDPLSDKCPKK